MRPSFTDLQVFLHACESGSMTAAAERSCLTLAAVSARLRRLEDEAGVLLLRRHARGVEATAAGDALAAHARRVLQEVERLRQGMRAGRPEEGTLLLANTAALGFPLTPLAGWLAERGHAAPVFVRESTSEATVQALHANLADVGIVSDAVACDGLRVEVLGPDPLLLLAPRAHPLGALPQVRFAQALEHEWVAWGEDTALGTHLAMQAQRLGLPLRKRLSYPRVADIVALVAQGFGVTVVPATLLSARARDALAVVPLAESWARRRLLICRRAGAAGPTVLAVFEGVREIWRQPDRRASKVPA